MKKTLLFLAAGVMSCTAAMGQWNSDPAINMLGWPDGESYYSTEVKMCQDGKTWVAINFPNTNGVSTALQLVDTAGNWMFEEPLVLAEFPSRTWTSFGQVIYPDRDGNAIVAVYDQRYNEEGGNESYSVYKISQTGEFLWGETGIALEGETTYDLVASMSICQLTDGSYAFAWMHNQPNDYNKLSIEMQRLSADGEMLWDAEEVRMYDDKIDYSYPYLIDGGSNQLILVYAKGSAKDLYARKIDFDGTSVWSEDTRIYNGGWGSIPALWSFITVIPSGDGGALVSWNDDRYFTNIESAYMAYVKPNGELGFNVSNGLKLGYSELRCLDVKCHYDKASDSFYAFWNECSSGQSWNRMVAQRVSKDGELLWSEVGVEIEPLEQTDYGYNSIQSGADEEVGFFYMHSYESYQDVECLVTLVNANDTTLRRKCEFTKGSRVSSKAGMVTTPMYDNKFWVVKWSDNGGSEDEERIDRLMLQRLNNNLTLGNPGDAAVESVKADNNIFEALATIVNNEAMFAVNVPAATPATLTIYNVNGALVATPFNGELSGGKQYIEWAADVPAGMYIATLTTSQGVETVKLIVK